MFGPRHIPEISGRLSYRKACHYSLLLLSLKDLLST